MSCPTIQNGRLLTEVFGRKYGEGDRLGWGPRLRSWFGYFTSDDIYEATVSALVTADTSWLDVGCGRDIFPSNPGMARILAERCQILVGLDPSDNIDENPFLYARFKGLIEDYETCQRFDLITLRMVAEHINDPPKAVSGLSRLSKPGARVIVYTVFRWSPATIISSLIPFNLHHRIKQFLWKTVAKDTFPTCYQMNTRRCLQGIFAEAGFTEEQFEYLDDCGSFARWRSLTFLELLIWKVFRSVGFHYPEVCLLGIYRKAPALG